MGFGGLGDIVAFIGVSGDAQFIAKMKAMDVQAANTSQNVNKALNIAMAAAAVTIGLATSAAIKFESSFAGVTKTVDGLRDPLGKLNNEGIELANNFRKLALEIPISVNELNKIGELGGQLGIAKSDLISFTDTIAKLGVTTDLSIDAAATSMARFVNVTKQVAPDGMSASQQIERLGSTVVALGNTTATTESQILAMATRIAGAGNVVGLTQAEILGFSAALSSVGIEAQAGGTSISKAFIEIATSVETGNENLSLFAEASKMSVDKFSKLFREDAAGAMIKFIEGLGNVEEGGESVFVKLEKLGISEIRMRDALLKGASASDLFTKALKDGSEAYKDNNALTKEAGQRFETLESQLKLVGNILNDAFIDIGQDLTPILATLTTFFKDNPAMVKEFVINFAAIIIPLGVIIGLWKAYNAVQAAWIGLGLAKHFATMKLAVVSLGASFALLTIGVAAVGIAFLAIMNAASAAEASIAKLHKATKLNNDVQDRANQLVKNAVSAYEELKSKNINDLVKLNGGEWIKVGDAISLVEQELKDYTESSGKNLPAVALQFKNAGDETSKLVDITTDLKDAGIETTSMVRDQVKSLEALKSEVRNDEYALSQLNERIEELKDKLSPTIKEIQAMKDGFGENNDIVPELRNNMGQLKLEMKGVKSHAEQVKEANDKLKGSIKGIVGAIDILGNAFGGISGPLDSFLDSLSSFASGDIIGSLSAVAEMGMAQVQKSKDIVDAHAASVKSYINALENMKDVWVDIGDIGREQWDNLSSSFENFGIVTEESVRLQIGELTNLMVHLQEGSFEYEQVKEKLEALYETLGEPAPWNAQQANVDMLIEKYGSVEAAMEATKKVIDALTKSQGKNSIFVKGLQAVYDDLGDSILTTEEIFADLGFETEESVRAQIESLEELLTQYDANSYEAQQLRDKLDTLYSKLGETSSWEKAEAAAEAFRKEMEEEVQAAVIKTAAEIASLEGQIAVWVQQMKDIDLETEKSIAPLNEELARLDELITDLKDRSIQIDIQAGEDIAEQEGIIAAYTTFIEKLQNAGSINLDTLHDELEQTLGLTKAITISFDEMNAAMLQDYSQFEKDMQAVNAAIDQLTYFDIDFDTTTADEQINSAIIRMQDYLKTLTPGSQAYIDAKAGLDAMTQKFVDMGGEIDRDKAYAFDISEAERKAQEAQDAIGDIKTTAEEEKALIGIELHEAYLAMFNIRMEILGLKKWADDNKAEIQIKIDDAKLKIDELIDYLSVLSDKTITIDVKYNYLNNPTDGLSSIGSQDTLASTSPTIDNNITVNQPPVIIEDAGPMARAVYVDNVVDPRQRETSRFTITRGAF